MKNQMVKIEVLKNNHDYGLTINDHLIAGRGLSGSWNILYSASVKLSEINAIAKRLLFNPKTGEIKSKL